MRAFVIIFTLCASALAYVPRSQNIGQHQQNEIGENIISPANVANLGDYEAISKSAQAFAHVLNFASPSNAEVTGKSQEVPVYASVANLKHIENIAESLSNIQESIYYDNHEENNQALLASTEQEVLYRNLAETVGALAKTLNLYSVAIEENAPATVKSEFKKFSAIATNPTNYEAIAKVSKQIYQILKNFNVVPVQNTRVNVKSAVFTSLNRALNPENYKIISELSSKIGKILHENSGIENLLSSEYTAKLYYALAQTTLPIATAINIAEAVLTSTTESEVTVKSSIPVALAQGVRIQDLTNVIRSSRAIENVLSTNTPSSMGILESFVKNAEVVQNYEILSESAGSFANALESAQLSQVSVPYIKSVADVLLTNEATPKLFNAIATAAGSFGTAYGSTMVANVPHAGAFAKSASVTTITLATDTTPYETISKTARILSGALNEAEQKLLSSSEPSAKYTVEVLRSGATGLKSLSEAAESVSRVLKTHVSQSKPSLNTYASVLTSPASVKLLNAIVDTVYPFGMELYEEIASVANSAFINSVQKV